MERLLLEDEITHVWVELSVDSRGGIGLEQEVAGEVLYLTPAQARAMADWLLKAADEVERAA